MTMHIVSKLHSIHINCCRSHASIAPIEMPLLSYSHVLVQLPSRLGTNHLIILCCSLLADFFFEVIYKLHPLCEYAPDL